MELIFSVDCDFAQEVELSDAVGLCNRINQYIHIPYSDKPYLLLINPKSGIQKGAKIYENLIAEIFDKYKVKYQLMLTEQSSHACKFIQSCKNLSDYKGIVTVSGDGLIYEVFCGIMERESWKEDLESIPIGVIAAGSGNGLAATISAFSGVHPSRNLTLHNTLILKNPSIQSIDLMRLQTSRGKQCPSFLSLTWGLIANVDVGSDKLRWMGPARFNFAAVMQIAKLSKLKAKLWYLPMTHQNQSSSSFKTTQSDSNSFKNSKLTEQTSSRSYDFRYLPDISVPLPENVGWILLDDKFIGIVITLLPYISWNAYVAPFAKINDGKIHLLLIDSNISRSELLSFISKIESGQHLPNKYIIHIECCAFRLVPDCDKCIMAVDGEPISPGSIQGEIMPSSALVFTGLNSEGELFI